MVSQVKYFSKVCKIKLNTGARNKYALQICLVELPCENSELRKTGNITQFVFVGSLHL